MKANKFFLGLALIGAILTGCDKGQEPETPEGNGIKADAYVSVKISMASTVGTRATDGGFEAGTADEQKIDGNRSIFLFYDSIGNWVTSGVLATQAPGNDSIIAVDTTNILNSRYTDAYIVLSGPDKELQKSRQVLTVVNYSNCESLKQLNLSEALAQVTTEATDSAHKGFLMTTSVYFDNNGNLVNTTAITADNIQLTASLAEEKPVEIFIERASAKATLSVTASQPTVLPSDSGIVVDGVIKAVEITVNKWNLNNVYQSTYLVKQLDNGWSSTVPFSGWNWAEAKRSYFAKSHHWIDNTGETVVRSYNQATIAPNSAAYCYENTVENPVCSAGVANPNVNTVLIAAQFNVEGESHQNLYKYSGVFYRETTYKNLILKQIKDAGYVKEDNNDLTISDISIISDGTLAGVKFTVKNQEYKKYDSTSEQYVDINDATPDSVNVETFVNSLAYVTQTVGYADGKCYYQIPVEHLGDAGSAQYGMVRNHLYKITVSKIKRIGEPVFDETEDIPGIPEETTEHYLAAEIHVLSWHVVNQNVEL